MDLSKFGTNVRSDKNSTTVDQTSPSNRGSDQGSVLYVAQYSQWTVVSPRKSLAVGATQSILDPGLYRFEEGLAGSVLFSKQDINVDDLLLFPDSLSAEIIKEIDEFWNREDKFAAYRFLHRRGYLLWGPAGSGKSCLVQQVVQQVIEREGIVFQCFSPQWSIMGLGVFRQVEPKRKVVCLYEDIDAIVEKYDESSLLSLLDGENQIDHVLNIATTNYPERLDRRIVARPRRFDRIILIEMPSAIQRKFYFMNKLQIEESEVDQWVVATEGFSFASLAELVISVKCLGNDFDKTVKHLHDLNEAATPSSDQYSQAKVGFGK